MSYTLPFIVGSNAVDETLVTVRDAEGRPMFTTHDRVLAAFIADTLESLADRGVTIPPRRIEDA